MVWSAEHKQQILAAWDRGETASVIAARFVVSRNAIIGLVNRAKANKADRSETKPATQAKSAKQTKRAPGARKKRAVAQSSGKGWRDGPPKPATSSRPDLSRHILPGQPPVALSALGPHQCRFPLVSFDAPSSADMPCCGAGALLGQSWCAHHYSIVFPSKAGTRGERSAARDLARLG